MLITARIFSGSLSTSKAITPAFPAVGRRSVESILIIVVFPAPFGPRTPNISPFRTCRSTPSRAVTLPSLLSNSRLSPSTWTVISVSTRFITFRDLTIFPGFSVRHLTIGRVSAIFVAFGSLALVLWRNYWTRSDKDCLNDSPETFFQRFSFSFHNRLEEPFRGFSVFSKYIPACFRGHSSSGKCVDRKSPVLAHKFRSLIYTSY